MASKPDPSAHIHAYRGSEITHEVMSVTPTKAKEWLNNSHNRPNRHLSPARVSKLVKDMLAGNWKCNGDAIRFYEFDGIADGQHRLQACIQSGVTIKTLVVGNLNIDCLPTIDQGRPKRRHDILRMSGFKASTMLAPALRFAASYLSHGDPTAVRDVTRTLYSQQAVLDFVGAHPDLYDAAQDSPRLYKKTHKLLTPASAVALLWIMRRVDHDDAETFFADLHLGANLSANDPVFLLRERLTKDREYHLKRNEVIDSTIRWMRLTAVAWNARRRGSTLRRLNLPSRWPKLI
jgi:hypothetical protein